MNEQPQSDLLAAALSLAADAITAEVSTAFDDAGIEYVLLKGPSTAEWLYSTDGAARLYADSDLLVAPRDFARASETLAGLGFRARFDAVAHPGLEPPLKRSWLRGNADVDLHCQIDSVGCSADRTWDVLTRDPEHLEVGGVNVRVLAEPARALLVALHALHHGHGAAKTEEDLRRALAQAPSHTWERARSLARELQAEGSLGSGLRMLPEGDRVANALGLARGSVADNLRLSGVPMAQGLEDLASVRGWRGKLALAVRELAPTPAFMCWWRPWTGRGRAFMVAGYLYRPLWLCAHLPSAVRGWRRAHREAGPASGGG